MFGPRLRCAPSRHVAAATFASAACLCFGWSAKCHAEPISQAVTLYYQAPQGCPSEEEYRRATAARMPPQPSEPRSAAPVAGAAVSVQIGLAETGQYVGRLRIVVGGGSTVERLLSDVKCDVLVDALALLTSMETGSTGAEVAPGVVANPVVVTTNQPPRLAEPTPKVETPRPEVSVDRPIDWTVSALVGLITAPAPNPLPSGGVAIMVGRLHRSATLGLSLQYAQSSALRFDGGDVRFKWAAARVIGCPTGVSRHWMTLSACAIAEAGLLRTEAENTLRGTSRSRGWIAPGGGGLLTLRFDGVALNLLSGAIFPLIRDEFYFAGASSGDSKHPVHTAPVVGLAAELRLGATF